MPVRIDPILVKKCFDYSPETGVLTRVSTLETKGRKPQGRRIHIAHNGKKYYKHGVFKLNAYEHRIIWIWMTGEQPDTIDHIDGDGLNNKWSNLRSVKFSDNGKNQKKHTTNTSGYAGVSYRKDSDKWRARIMVNGKPISVGTFQTKEAAIHARDAANSEYGFHENHGKRLTA
jgi:hypothetical protein